MTRKWIMAVGFSLLAAQASAEEAPVLKTEKDKMSYGIGVEVGRNFKRLGVEVDTDLVVKGLREALSGEKLLMTDEELRDTMTAYQAEVRQKQAQAARLAAENNKKAGEAFLADNKTKAGVVTLPSGLQYKILKAGNGKTPTETDTVECHYRGTLINGTEFDSSYRRGQPATLKVTGVIPGWREALKLMPVGSKWQIVIPSQLAYGERGAGRDIGPNATLIFELELLAIK
ncbi:MAG: FKBP-type peptidyl-prolyl cis-trans isomerase [Candidatus Methylomirabilis oxyfera]|nr:FKBP-type peptidyl-prolyl cis-trans isomerase [Candidatus Methylomirabilis oxyfera]